MDRALQWFAALIAVAVSSAAQGESNTATVATTDASSIILAPKPVAGPTQLVPGSGTGGRPTYSADTESPSRIPAFSSESTSSHISEMIAAGLPQFNPVFKAADTAFQGTTPDRAAIRATPGIDVLPAFVVRDAKIPDDEHMLTNKARAEAFMDKHLGPRDGLDRGFLNRYSLQQLWRKIPIIGVLPFVGTPVQMTNLERALDAAGVNDRNPNPHSLPKEKEGSDDAN